MARILTVEPRSVGAGLAAQRTRLTVTLVVALAIALVFASHYEVTASLIAIYDRNETFAHGYLVVPMVLWLVWRRGAVAATRPVTVPYYPLALLVLTAAAGWLATRINVVFVSQLAMVAMVPLLVWLWLGTQATRELVFPLFILFFAVPFGDVLVPKLIDWTGNFVVVAIRASGVPVFREGNVLTIPSGRWSIVEACAGLRYLIASVLVGVLFAYLSYRSAWRRAVFILTAVLVPIVANWLRAYMIVMLGHLTDNRLAVGVDHIIYGWLFFGLVMLLLFTIGSRWREERLPDEDDASPPAAHDLAAHGRAAEWISPPAVIAVAIVATSAVVQVAASNPVPASAARLPVIAAAGAWRASDATVSDWLPDLRSPTQELHQVFVKGGVQVGLHVALYRDQTRDAKAIASTNQLVEPGNPLRVLVESGSQALDRAGGPAIVNTAVVAAPRERLLVWQWFWVDGHYTATRYGTAFHQALAALRGRNDAVAWIVLYTPVGDGPTPEVPALRDFAAAIAPVLDADLREAVARP